MEDDVARNSEESAGVWRVFFHRPTTVAAAGDLDPVVSRHRDVLDRAAARLRKGQPFFVGPEGLAEVRINRWFDSDGMRGLSRASWCKYAYSVRTWLNFLILYGVTWDVTDPKALEAFKVWRLMDERNPRRVSAGTYHHDLIAVRLFYVWAATEFGIVNPIRTRGGRGDRRAWPRRGLTSGRPVTAPPAIRDRDVKWFDPAGFVRYRDLGLMGLGTDGRDRNSARGRNGQRDGAFVDGLYGTGLRLQEWGSIMLIELPADDPSRQFRTCSLASATAKYGRGRQYWMPRAVLSAVLSYAEGERATAVRRAQRSGRYDRLTDALVVTTVLGARRLRLLDAAGHASEVSIDALDPVARRRLFVDTAVGREPAALWLNEDGMPRDPHGWSHTFQAANARLAGMGFIGFAGSAHMLRHSFALRWYSVGRLLFEARFGYLSEEETRDFREQFGSAWDLVQLMLGHADPRTTQEIYLEPFRSLEMELLMLHAAQAAVPQLMSAVLAGDRRVLNDPFQDAE